jgi:hypothetical protein
LRRIKALSAKSSGLSKASITGGGAIALWATFLQQTLKILTTSPSTAWQKALVTKHFSRGKVIVTSSGMRSEGQGGNEISV